MVDCTLAGNRNKPECRVVLRNRCMSKSLKAMPAPKIKRCINTLIYSPPKRFRARDKELLSIVVLRSKKRHFSFLKGRTRWNTVGDWINEETGRYFPAEKNVQLDVEFKDRKDELIGKQLIKLFNELNRKKVGEELLYSRTVPVEESSLP